MFTRQDKQILFCKANITNMNSQVSFTNNHFYEVIDDRHPSLYEVIDNFGVYYSFNKVDINDPTYYTNWFGLGSINMETVNETYNNTRHYRIDFNNTGAGTSVRTAHLVFYNANYNDYLNIQYEDAIGDWASAYGNVFRTISAPTVLPYEVTTPIGFSKKKSEA